MASNLRVDSIVPATGSSVSIGTGTGGVNIPGVLTYEDVTNVDSIGIITARSGIRISAGSTVGPVSGIITYFGDGSQLTGISVDPSTAASSAGFLKVLNASTPQIRLNNDASDGATTRAFFGIATGNNNYINGSVANDTVLSARVAGDLLIGCGSTVRMRISENGHITKPNHPSFHATKTNGDAPANSYVVFNNVNHNNGSHYNASDGKFTAPVTGVYYFSVWHYTGSTSAISFRINGSQYGAYSWDGQGGFPSWVCPMTAGDYAQIFTVNPYGFRGTADYHNAFNGFLIG